MDDSERFITVATHPIYDSVGIVVASEAARIFASQTCTNLRKIPVGDVEGTTLENLVGFLGKKEPAGYDDPTWTHLDRLMALIIGEELLGHPQLMRNFLTPIICISQRRLEEALAELMPETPTHTLQSAQERYNLYGLVSTQDKSDLLLELLKEATDAKQKLVGIIKHFPRICKKLEPVPEPPRFINLQPRLSYYDVLREELRKTRTLSYLMWNGLVDKLRMVNDKAERLLCSQYGDLRQGRFKEITASDLEHLKKTVLSQLVQEDAKHLRALVNYFLEQNLHMTDSLVKIDEESGEGGISADADSNQYQPFRMGAFRIEKAKNNVQGMKHVPAYLIALQRYIYALRFKGNTNYLTPMISVPICCEQNGEQCAFWATEYIPGTPLNEVIEILTQEKEKDKSNTLPARLRSKLIRHYIKSVAYFTKNAGNTFIPKPDAQVLTDYYTQQISGLPHLLRDSTKISIQQDEENLWQEIVSVLECIHYSKKNIVLNRDASLNNGIVHSRRADQPNDSIETIINDLTEISKDNKESKEDMPKMAPSDLAISRALYNVDHQIRWGHITEDIAQIITMYEARWLWDKAHKDSQRRLLLNEFLHEAGFEQTDQLYDDFDHMCFYRAARKLALFCNYWTAHLSKRKGEYDRNRKEHIVKNLIHYSDLAIQLSRSLGEKITTLCKDTNDEAHIKQASDLLNSHGQLYEECARQYLDLIRKSRRNDAKNAIRYFAACDYFRKIRTALNEDCLKDGRETH